MKTLAKTLEFQTHKPLDFIDISHEVRDFAETCGLKNAILIVASSHTTTALVINEKCSELQKDMLDFLTRIVPPQSDYRHNKVAVDGRPNTHSHLLSLFMSSQQSLILQDSKLQLGTWQSIFLVELDGPRECRKVTLTLMGE